jgi:hypothetical protein
MPAAGFRELPAAGFLNHFPEVGNMGEYAYLMISGEVCSICGCEMHTKLGVPGVCRSCWKSERGRQQPIPQSQDQRAAKRRKRQNYRRNVKARKAAEKAQKAQAAT